MLSRQVSALRARVFHRSISTTKTGLASGYGDGGNAATIDVNTSQGQATQYNPGENKDEHKDYHGEQKQQKQVSERRQRKRAGDNASFFSDLIPSVFRAPNPLDWFGASDFPMFSEQASFMPSSITPKVDFYETSKNFMMDVEIPGMKKEDLKIRVEDNLLTISGEKKFERNEEDKKHKYRRMERSYGSFHRAFELPAGVDHSQIEAKYAHGVLKIAVPKPPEDAEQREVGRNIEIKDA